MTTRDPATRLGQRYPGKRALITGAASGLGLALARALHAAGWRIGLADISGERLAELAETLGSKDGPAYTYTGDVADEEFLAGATSDFARTQGGLDVMINNAGVAVAGAVEATPPGDWRWIVDINLLGVVWGCRAAVPIMRAQQSGVILNIASSAGFAAAPQMAAYNVTKSAVISLSETLAGELYGSGVQVSVAMPGFFRTSLLNEIRAPSAETDMARRLMQGSGKEADEAAQALLHGLDRRSLYIVWPSEYRLLWHLKRFLPITFLRLTQKLRQKKFPAADQPR